MIFSQCLYAFSAVSLFKLNEYLMLLIKKKKGLVQVTVKPLNHGSSCFSSYLARFLTVDAFSWVLLSFFFFLNIFFFEK